MLELGAQVADILRKDNGAYYILENRSTADAYSFVNRGRVTQTYASVDATWLHDMNGDGLADIVGNAFGDGVADVAKTWPKVLEARLDAELLLANAIKASDKAASGSVIVDDEEVVRRALERADATAFAVEGAVQAGTGTLRLTLRLVRNDNGVTAWAGTYEASSGTARALAQSTLVALARRRLAVARLQPMSSASSAIRPEKRSFTHCRTKRLGASRSRANQIQNS